MAKAKVAIVDIELVSGPIHAVWNAVASDMHEMGRVTNTGAIEVCIDANRLTEFAYDKAAGKVAEDEITRAIDAHGYPKVLRALARAISLV